jgi:hypothetical protein
MRHVSPNQANHKQIHGRITIETLPNQGVIRGKSYGTAPSLINTCKGDDYENLYVRDARVRQRDDALGMRRQDQS